MRFSPKMKRGRYSKDSGIEPEKDKFPVEEHDKQEKEGKLMELNNLQKSMFNSERVRIMKEVGWKNNENCCQIIGLTLEGETAPSFYYSLVFESGNPVTDLTDVPYLTIPVKINDKEPSPRSGVIELAAKEASTPETSVLSPAEVNDTQVKPSSSRKRTRENVMKSG